MTLHTDPVDRMYAYLEQVEAELAKLRATALEQVKEAGHDDEPRGGTGESDPAGSD